ncbi:MAG: hypothetical protein KIH01_00720 [Candidatus Freyarchaeota archaeon]|nr:hypothetical protein [Candidatus Jordarchaeia archaeon]
MVSLLSSDKEPGFDDLMKSLFDSVMGAMFQELAESFGKLPILISAAENHGKEKKNTCTFYRGDVCNCWCWKDEPSSEPFILVSVKKGDGWYIDPHPIYCALCFAYEESEEEDEEEWSEDELEDERVEEDEWSEEDEE